ncbi:MAG: amino acid adenylation domain-containing protein [Verrucomicrobiae bacterium]|nr:amino acid adenylation domain-containing protein [Verrucomicrobiae bacterium]
MFSDLEKMFYDGSYVPLPNHVFPITEVVEAFRFMAAGKHIGKNVLDFDQPVIEIGDPTEEGHRFRGDGTYLITGGAGGFGLELAGWMAKNGARHFALMSRSGPNEESLEKIEALRASGVEIIDARGDVTSRADIDRIVAQIQEGKSPLIGVIHGAMVLDDEFLVELDEARFDKVLLPKMLGAWNLHEATLGIPLEHFICFSSFSAVIGAVKQSNYNAGNVFLDQLAHHRRSLGLPALTFNWGALEGAGFVARNEKTQQYLEMVGLGATNMEETLHLFSVGVPTDAVQLGTARCDWGALARFSPSVSGSNMFLPVVPRSNSGGGDSMAARILEAPAEKRLGLVEDLIAAQVGAVLGTDPTRLDKDTPLTNLGLDSLMAIELVNRIEEKLGMSMPMGSVLNGPNIRDLSIPVLEKLLESGGGAASGGGSGIDASALVPFEATGELPEVFSLSEGQKALWFLNRLAPESSAYNLVFSGKFRPLLDIAAMKKAFALLFERHPLMDTTFTTRGGEPVQVVHKGRTIDFREHDCSSLDEEELKALISEHADRPFNLERGPVVRLELFRTADNAHVALLSMHHIVSDAWSVSVLIQDLIEYYFSAKAGRTPKVEPIAATYADFVKWEQAHLASGAGEKMFEFWQEHLAGAPAALDLPTDRPRPPVQTFNGATFGFQLDRDLTESVDGLAKENGVTLFSTLLSAYNLLMHRYCQQEDIVIGVPLAGRTQSELRNSVGYFINPVPLRSVLSDDLTVSDFLAASSRNVNGALENQQYPLSKLVDRLHVVRDAGRSPLFQVSFSMEKVPGIDEQGIAVFLIGQGGHTFHVGDLSMETIDLTTRHAQFEITLTLEEAGGQLFGCWHYNRDLFDEGTIAELCGLYEQVLREMTRVPASKLSELKLLGEAGEQKVLVELNDTVSNYEKDALLHQLVEKVALSKDEEPAVVFGDTQMTYGELNRLANGVARDLAAAKVGAGDTVGVLADRSPRMIAALLGVLKTGAAYVPLDPEFPASRLSLMLEDASPKALLASGRLVSSLPEGSWSVVDLDGVEGTSKSIDIKGLKSDNLAYIIYTSGSTGKPKGVEIPHRAAVNFLRSMEKTPGLGVEDRLLAVTTLSFDISLLEMFLPLLCGATVVVASSEDAKDGRRLAKLLETEDITVMQATPATWQMLLDSGWEGRSNLRIFCGGEAMSRSLANSLANSAAEVWNLYGPTETTVWSTVEKIEEGESAITIGRPIANTGVYLLDEHLRPVPAGFTGELWIGGDGLARGYRNQPELTAAAFREIELPLIGKRRLYRTGDLARWTRDDRLECLGRVDFQVKLRGVRMELGDIETQMASIPGIKQAVVVKREDLPTGEGLVGYFIAEGAAPDAGTIREHLSSVLPQSYIPAFYKELEEFPLTPNRKIDRRRLPLPSFGGDGKRVAARDEIEAKILAVFEKNFEAASIGVTDNFFEIGGDSLLALRIIVELSDLFGQQIPVDAFLTHPSIEQLARYLGSEPVAKKEADTADKVAVPAGVSLDDLDHINMELAPETMPKLDAVALTYIPDVLANLSGFSRDEISERLFGGKPRLTNVYELEEGRIGVVMLPCYETDFYKNQASVKAPVLAALKLAADAGAGMVSLTGVIPSATDHGREIEKWMEGEKNLPGITTGDATRSATIVKSVEGILGAAGRKLENETVSVVGLGSIGFGTLRLMLDVLEHPKHLILCDPYQTDDQMSRVRDHIRDAGYFGQIDIVKNGGALPPEVYEASLVIASSNLPGVLRVPALKSGTLVVDYSFPPVFKLDEAVKRFVTQGDILFTTGGELRLSGVVGETIYLPEDLEGLDEGVQTAFLNFLGGRDRHEITGCVLASLVTGRKEGVEATLGALENDDAQAHYDYLNEFGATPAKLQMSGFFLPEEAIAAFREGKAHKA